MNAELGVFPKDRLPLGKILPVDTPLSVNIHVTHLCNLQCCYCVLSQSEEGFAKSGLHRDVMSWETFETVVEQLKEFPRKIKTVSMCGIGEALTHPRIVDIVKAIHDANITDRIEIISNGLLLTPELGEKLVDAGLDVLKISLQGITPERYIDIAGATINWDQFYENIRHFSSIRGKCKLNIKTVDIALGEGEEEKFYALFGDMCDSIAVEHVIEYWSVLDADLDYRKKDIDIMMYGLQPIENKVCRYPFTSVDILPDGMYAQFCRAHFGFEKNIREVSIKEQWNGEGQNCFRLAMLDGIDQFEQCRKCNIVSGCWHPEDIIMGYEDEIRERMGKLYGTTGNDMTVSKENADE